MYRWYALGVLALTYAFSVMDRQILSILLEDLRAEFLLSDTQLGLLSGIAFALFYATLGIPIARLADRSNRVNIISIAVAVWSVATVRRGRFVLATVRCSHQRGRWRGRGEPALVLTDF